MYYGELNPPMEMVRRLAFLVYVLVFTTYLFSCVIALVRPGGSETVVALTSFSALAVIRYAGYRWLDFKRLSDSFPGGCAMDRIPQKVRTEVESLVHEFHANGTDWTRRVAIRHRLVELEELEPELQTAYEEELREVLAA